MLWLLNFDKRLINHLQLILFCLSLGLTQVGAATLTADDCQAFLKSFINHYEFNPEGRYTHEYHPFLLNWTAQSFDNLEQQFHANGLSLQGRMVIMGYEEGAVSPYYTNFKQPKIDDEAIRRNNAGWSLRLHNRFGFMSGFLCKDIPNFTKQNIFQHIDADRIPIFDNRATIFQEHAFGDALPLLYKELATVNHLIKQQSDRAVLQELAAFWQMLYEHAFTVGNKQIAGTQDVLFSIAYARYLLRSSLPINKFFTGPDITYPIEVTAKQQKYATIHAQHFVQNFVTHLQPVNDQNTVYIFCSFVDGVGKSTMLGNIKNWMKWGGDIDHFNHVDNSSSQLAELFQFKDKVFIADLPAQVSHFTYKPDGLVYVDARTCLRAEEVTKIEAFLKDKQTAFQEAYTKQVQEVKTLLAQQGYDAPALNDLQQPAKAFIKNVLLLKKESANRWIPFEFEGKSYLYKDVKPLEIRTLIPLGVVTSEGLKNIEAEQMLFVEGVRLPLPYQTFLDDLLGKLKKQEIKQVVFVDFLSMYPRSSRENIRVNYLLQQLALLNNQFDPKLSLYRDFVSGGELLYLLLNETSSEKITLSCTEEARLRLALFAMVLERTEGDLGGVSISAMTKRLHEIEQRLLAHDVFTRQLVHDKIEHETALMQQHYGLSKAFVNIQQFSLAKAEMLYRTLQQFFTESVDNESINNLWADQGTPVAVPVIQTEGERLQGAAASEKGVMFRGYFVCNPECKNTFILTPLIRSLRACWYASVLNLFTTQDVVDEVFCIKKPFYKVVPLSVQTIKGLVYVVQQSFDSLDKIPQGSDRLLYRPFNLISFKPAAFTMIDDVMHRLEWESDDTHSGLMGFACESFSEQKDDDDDEAVNAASKLMRDYLKEHGAHTVMPASELWEQLHTCDRWAEELDEIKEKAHKAGWYKGQHTDQKRELSEAHRLYLGPDKYRPVAQAVVRLLATIEMVLKDPDADIVIRDGNRDDFAAGIKLLEKVLLPMACGIYFEDDLFDDYTQVEPYPSWEWWDAAR